MSNTTASGAGNAASGVQAGLTARQRAAAYYQLPATAEWADIAAKTNGSESNVRKRWTRTAEGRTAKIKEGVWTREIAERTQRVKVGAGEDSEDDSETETADGEDELLAEAKRLQKHARALAREAEGLRREAERSAERGFSEMEKGVRAELSSWAEPNDKALAGARAELSAGEGRAEAMARLEALWGESPEQARAVGGDLKARLEGVANQRAVAKQAKDEDLLGAVTKTLRAQRVKIPAGMTWAQLSAVGGKSAAVRVAIEGARAEKRLVDSIPPAFRAAGVGPHTYNLVEGLAESLKFATERLREVADPSWGARVQDSALKVVEDTRGVEYGAVGFLLVWRAAVPLAAEMLAATLRPEVAKDYLVRVRATEVLLRVTGLDWTEVEGPEGAYLAAVQVDAEGAYAGNGGEEEVADLEDLLLAEVDGGDAPEGPQGGKWEPVDEGEAFEELWGVAEAKGAANLAWHSKATAGGRKVKTLVHALGRAKVDLPAIRAGAMLSRAAMADALGLELSE